MSVNSRTGAEALLAVASIAIGVTGAALVEPVILGVAAAGAVVATAMRFYDKSQKTTPTSTPKGKVKVAV